MTTIAAESGIDILASPGTPGGKQDGYGSCNFGVRARPKAARLMPEIASVNTNTEHDVLRR